MQALEAGDQPAARTAPAPSATTRFTRAASSPSAMTRISFSVPDGRTSRRPEPTSADSASAMAAWTVSVSNGLSVVSGRSAAAETADQKWRLMKRGDVHAVHVHQSR